MAVNSIQKRYFVKLAVSVCSSLFGLISIGIVPRALGPAQYGNFSFLNKTLSQFLLMLQFSSENSFSTKLAQRNYDLQLIGFYTILFLLSSIVFFVCTAMTFVVDITFLFFPDQQIENIFMAAAHVVLLLLSTRLIAIADAFALTAIELMKILQRFVYVCMVIIAVNFYSLDLKILYILHYIATLTFIIKVISILIKEKIIKEKIFDISFIKYKYYFKEFYQYSIPLIHKSFIVFATVYIEFWMLLRFGGSKQVGYFGFSQNIVIIVSTLTIAMVPVIHREFSEAYARSKMEEIKDLFLKYVPKVFILVTFVNVFCAVELEKIVLLLGGDNYQESLQPGFILLITSIMNPIILLSSALLLSTDHTKEIRNITLLKVFIGIIAAYILITPKNYYGLGLGAIGLAVKIAVVQVYSLIAYLYIVSKYLGFNFLKFLIKAMGSAIILFFFAMIAASLFDYDKNQIGLIKSFLLDGIVYTFFSTITILCLPSLFFLEKNELLQYAKRGFDSIKLLFMGR